MRRLWILFLNLRWSEHLYILSDETGDWPPAQTVRLYQQGVISTAMAIYLLSLSWRGWGGVWDTHTLSERSHGPVFQYGGWAMPACSTSPITLPPVPQANKNMEAGQNKCQTGGQATGFLSDLCHRLCQLSGSQLRVMSFLENKEGHSF